MITDRMEFCRANIAAQNIADSANVAYWMACENSRVDHHEKKMHDEFCRLADILGYSVAPAPAREAAE